MKHQEAPACPRCNRNSEVRKISYELVHLAARPPARERYVLAGTLIRPDNFDWYCDACAERFGAPSENWGRLLTELLQ
jgi:ribosomal protein L37AE/L43A